MFKISGTGYGIFDTFATDDARTAHINGQIPAALAKVSAAPGADMAKLAGRSAHDKANHDRRDENPGPFGRKFMIPNEP
jgi:hypothetical protein